MPGAQKLQDQINALAGPYLAKRGYAALVIGIYQRGNKHVQGFGKFSGTNGNPPDAQTIFGIGSITKVFTAIVLVRMVEDGLLKLEDPISLYLPQGVASPVENGREITLKDLATHTSGLPRMPENFQAARDKGGWNPEAHYTMKDLYDSLAAVKLSGEPGKNASYSNYGYALLGRILELRSGKSYEQLIQEYVCEPLGLQNTTTQPSTQQKERLTPGHTPQGHILPNQDFKMMTSAGGILSNTEDLLKFIEANLDKTDTPISATLEKMHECLAKRPEGGIGLAWLIYEWRGQTFHHHSGATSGYISFAAFEKTQQTAAVLLSNYADHYAKDNSLVQMGMQLTYRASKDTL